MNILSIHFTLFVFIVATVYFVIPTRFQWLVLLIGSYGFYLFSGAKYAVYLLVITGSTYVAALRIDYWNQKRKYVKKRDDLVQFRHLKRRAGRVLLLLLIVNIGILLFLKYHRFGFRLLAQWLPASAVTQQLNVLYFVMPLGISFFTFQAVGYVLDVYFGRVEPTKHAGKYALFVAYFPQLVQGPISRFKDLYPRLEAEHHFDFERMVSGLQLVIWGVFKKLVIADRAALVVNEVFNNYTNYQGFVLFFGAMFYAIQIYGDFSGGIDVIRGVSEILGIELTENFRRPYFARSVSEFWQRWHITLGSWMRDYVFYPLALAKPIGRLGKKARATLGTRIGKQVPVVISSLIVFMLVGAWHGSSLKFIAYGLYNGLFVFSEPLLAPFYGKMRRFFHVSEEGSSTFHAFQMIRTFFITSIGRFFSRGERLLTSLTMIAGTFTSWNPWVLFDGTLYKLGLGRPEMNVLVVALFILFVVSYAQERGTKIRTWLRSQPLLFRWTLLIGLILFIAVYGMYGPGVAESDFIYGGF